MSNTQKPPARVIALTGCIGSGKSAVAEILAELGAVIIDADQLARLVVEPGTPGLGAVVSEFGSGVLDSGGSLDRKRLARLVFSDVSARQRLEAILHPLIQTEFLAFLNSYQHGENRLIVYVVPLLFESAHGHPQQALFNKIVVVSASLETCLERIIKRDHCSQAEALNRIRSQLPIKEKERQADFIIINDGPISELRPKVVALFEKLVSGVVSSTI